MINPDLTTGEIFIAELDPKPFAASP